MMKEIRYVNKELIYYHFCMPYVQLDCMWTLSRYVGKVKKIKVYIRHGKTHPFM